MKKLFLYLRAVLFYAGFYTVTIVYAPLCFLFALVLPKRPRVLLITGINFFYIFWLRVCCGLKVKVEGRENLPKEGAYVVVANHQSEWETLFFQTLIRPQSTVLKKELLKIPFFGWGLALTRPIAIDRSQRRGALKQLLEQGQERLDEGTPVLIFPQGTRVPVGKMGRFNKGGAMLAARAEVPLIPVVHDGGIFWPGKSFIKHPGTVTVRIGAPVAPRGQTLDQLHEASADWLQTQMVALKCAPPPKVKAVPGEAADV